MKVLWISIEPVLRTAAGAPQDQTLLGTRFGEAKSEVFAPPNRPVATAPSGRGLQGRGLACLASGVAEEVAGESSIQESAQQRRRGPGGSGWRAASQTCGD